MVRDRWEEHLHAYHVLLIFLKHLLKHISDFTMERFAVKSSFFQTCVQLQCWELLLETGCNYKDLWSDPPQLLSSLVLNCLPCNQDFVLWVCFRLKVKIIECCIQTTGLNTQEREPLPLPAHTGHIPSPPQVPHGKAAQGHVFKLLTATPLQRTLSWWYSNCCCHVNSDHKDKPQGVTQTPGRHSRAVTGVDRHERAQFPIKRRHFYLSFFSNQPNYPGAVVRTWGRRGWGSCG